MKKISITLVAVILTILPVSHNFSSKKGINWMTFEQATKMVESKPKKMLIDVYTDWCGWCKRMDKTTYEDASVIDYVNKNFYAVKLNAESAKTITFNSKSMTEQALSGQVFGVSGYPATVYLDEKSSVIGAVPGYWEAADFYKLNRYIAENIYQKKISFEEYKASVK